MSRAGEGRGLLPCPFCGGEASVSIGRNADNTEWKYISCGECDASVMSDDPEAWNKRAITDDMVTMARTVHVPTLNSSGYLHEEDARRVLEAALRAVGEGE